MSDELFSPFKQNEVAFHEPSHCYTEIETGKRPISATTLIGTYAPPFDPQQFIIRKCAARDGISVQELRAKWDKKRDDAADYGTEIHGELEYFFLTGKIKRGPHDDIIKKFKKIKFKGTIYPEVLIHSLQYMVAGTADILEYFPQDNSVAVRDLKTNRVSIYKKSYNKLLYPLNKLRDDKITKYELQVSLYCYMLEMRGFKIRENELCLFWVNPEDRCIDIIPVQYKKREVKAMLDHHVNEAF